MVIEKPMTSDLYLPTDRDTREYGYRRGSNSQSLVYPKAIYFIIANELCERLAYYGITSIMSTYLKEHLMLEAHLITTLSQVFLMFSYCFPLLGAMLADCWLDKYRTILFMSPVYVAGTIVVLVSTLPNVPGMPVAMAGLVLTYLGLGGVRPCLVAFGGDQFVLPQQESYLKKYFSIFYFAINAGGFIADILVPSLSERDCFGWEFCFFAGFCAVSVSITAATIIFVSGMKFYYVRKADGNVVLKMLKCICYAIKKRDKSGGHWLDKAQDRYDPSFINDIKVVLRILVLFIPLPFFRALFDQHGNRWHFQAARMSGDIGKLKLEAQQMNAANSIFILLLIPLFEAFVYPSFGRYNLLKKPLQRLTCGGLLAALAFVVSALVETQLEPGDEYLPKPNKAQIRLINGLTEPLNLEFLDTNLDPHVLPSLGMWSKLDLPLKGEGSIKIKYPLNGTEKTENFAITENFLTSYVFTPQRVIRIESQDWAKSLDGSPKIMILYIQQADEVELVARFCDDTEDYIITRQQPYTEYEETEECESYIVEKDGKIIFQYANMKQGGVYVALIVERDGVISSNALTVVQPNTLHMLWLVPQYVLITAGEVMFSITGFEFSFTQAPVSMKALLQAAWLLTAALGKVIVLGAGKTKLFERLFSEFLLFAALMAIDMLIFAALAVRYKYVKSPLRDDEAGTSDK